MRRRRLEIGALAAAALPGCARWGWLPPNVNGAYGKDIDSLYLTIMALVAVMFFLTEGALVYAIFRFRSREGSRARYSHGSKKTELLWSVVPGFILLWLALVQRDTWFRIRTQFPPDSEAVLVQVFPEQFAWNFRYAGADGKFGTKDDVLDLNEMHVPLGKKVVTRMTSKDVIHSFFLPLLRVKQDVVPGMLTRSWFQADRIPLWDLRGQRMALVTEEEFNEKRVAFRALPGIRKGFIYNFKPRAGSTTGLRDVSYDPPKAERIPICYGGKIEDRPREEAEYVLHHLDIACAELCGIQHYKMNGRLTIEPEFLFRDWLEKKAADIAENGAVETVKWTNIWDKYHGEYNR